MLESAQSGAPGQPSGGTFVDRVDASQVDVQPSSISIRRTVPLETLLRAEWHLHGDGSAMVTDVTHRSSEVVSGSLFFCIPGSNVDGHSFAGQACERGAAAVVAERRLDVSCTQVLVPSVRRAMGPISSRFFGEPSRGLNVTGVTGTNGKTTTTYLMESIFRAAGMAPGVIGTTGVRIEGNAVAFDRTTPEAPDLQRLLAAMSSQGVDAVAMEVSSHGLHQHRVDGTHFRCAVFTNLSQDHLDYHGTLEEYFLAKARLFTRELSEVGVVNADTAEGRRLAAMASIPIVTFGLDPGVQVRAEQVEVGAQGLSFRVGEMQLRSRLRGRFNVYNCLGAVAAARLVGIEPAALEEGIAAVPGVPGRLEPVEAGQSFQVLVDYAHTPDSLENVLRAARGFTSGRVIVVFGCGGDRDRGKRPLMGAAATRLADLTVVTSDNPRREPPETIIAEIEVGAERGGGAYRVEPDRRSAIRFAVTEARPGDAVILAGKGHEAGQQFADRTVPFDDRVVAREELEGLMEGRTA